VGALLLSAPLLAAALIGCSARSVPAAASSGVGQTVVNTPGSLTVVGQKNNPDSPSLRITGAVLVPGPQSDNDELRMTVTNLSQAEEHLYAASTASASSVGLFTTPPGAGATPQPADASGGVELDAGTTTVFGPGGPRILLEEPSGLAHARTVEVTLVFALAGIVHLTAVISPSAATTTATAASAPGTGTAQPTKSAG
jgi:copper(I)-binding protein